MAKSVRNPPTSASSSGEDFQDRETQEPQTMQPPNNPGTSLQLSNPGTSFRPPNPGTSLQIPGTSLQPPNPGTWRPLEQPLGT